MKTMIAAALGVAVLAACAPLPQPAPPPPAPAAAPAIALHALDCGEATMTDADMFADDGSMKNQPADIVVPCFLIRHPAGDLLWDTGLPEALASLPDGQNEGGFHSRMKRTLTAQLADLNLTPADIEYLSISHSHFDHAGNAGLFAASTWIVDAEERAHMFRREARAGDAVTQFAAYAALENAPTRLIEGDAAHDVFGDGSVTIHQMPGHTPGHTVLLVRLPETGPVLLSGDLYHFTASRAERRVPRFNFDRAQTLASMDAFEALARETGARVVIQHVRADFEALPAFPEALR